MGVITWAQNPWGQAVPVHIAWSLLWVSLFAGMAFLVVHAIWIRRRAKADALPEVVPPEMVSCIPENVPRHSLPARIFHWVMAAAMLTLLVSAFLPKIGLRFPWVNLHWAAGVVLTLCIVFHIVHAVFFMDFWSIWPNKADMRNAWHAILRAPGNVGPAPGKPEKYQFGNKLYHLAIVACGLCMAITGMLMMSRVRTPFFTRNPYLFDDMTWGMVYLLHGFAGVTLIALVTIHVYFALRPEKLPITRAMVFGTMKREYYLEHYDPRQWACDTPASQ